MGIFSKIYEYILEIINLLGILGPVFGCFLIVIESIAPILPLAVFITLNFITFGHFMGFIISWIFTLLGCVMSFCLFRKGFYKRFNNFVNSRYKLKKFMKVVSSMTLSELVVLTAIPFTPAFLVNIAAGLSDMSFKKYFAGIFLGKISLVYFWGYIGTSLIESLKNPIILIRIFVLVMIMYIISRFVNKKVNLE